MGGQRSGSIVPASRKVNRYGEDSGCEDQTRVQQNAKPEHTDHAVQEASPRERRAPGCGAEVREEERATDQDRQRWGWQEAERRRVQVRRPRLGLQEMRYVAPNTTNATPGATRANEASRTSVFGMA